MIARLEDAQKGLDDAKKALADFLDGKRTIFPRFYFVSEAQLLDILSNGNNPPKILIHIPSIFTSTKTLELDTSGEKAKCKRFIAGVGKENTDFVKPVELRGRVEMYLQDVLKGMQDSLLEYTRQSIERYPTQKREKWLIHLGDNGEPADPGQVALLVAAIMHTRTTEEAFKSIQAGGKDALTDYQATQLDDLTDLIRVTRTKLTKTERKKVMATITYDAHSRDFLAKAVKDGIQDIESFQWQAQLRPYMVDNKPVVKICDASFDYGFEYLGNGGRLVVTPLTDRIYVTATQALHLKMGCAPAGPAGTGKTETTKDLAAALGKICLVFNCAPEMDYRSMGNIFKGLAASGSWGCFDEFNRLIPPVLSVCTVQFKAVCDAIRAGSKRVTIEGVEVACDHTCGAFITMNPGYLGRSTLPEGLKALFRPMTVMVPDLVMICENFMMAEGFERAKE